MPRWLSRSLRIELMAVIQPDNVKDAAYQKAVHAAVLIRSDIELPRFALAHLLRQMRKSGRPRRFGPSDAMISATVQRDKSLSRSTNFCT
jgi:hypothetical protein